MTACSSSCVNRWPLMGTSSKNRANGSFVICASEPVCWWSAVMAYSVLDIEPFKNLLAEHRFLGQGNGQSNFDRGYGEEDAFFLDAMKCPKLEEET